MTTMADQEVSGLSLRIPGDWFAVDVPKDGAAADRLADELVTAYQATACPPGLLRTMVRQMVHAYSALGLAGAYVGIFSGAGGPLSMTLIVSTRLVDGYTMDEISAELIAQDTAVRRRTAVQVELPAGPAVRAEWVRDWPTLAEGWRKACLVVQYVLVPKPSQSAVILTFSTEAIEYTSKLRPLFDQIARTVRLEVPSS